MDNLLLQATPTFHPSFSPYRASSAVLVGMSGIVELEPSPTTNKALFAFSAQGCATDLVVGNLLH